MCLCVATLVQSISGVGNSPFPSHAHLSYSGLHEVPRGETSSQGGQLGTTLLSAGVGGRGTLLVKFLRSLFGFLGSNSVQLSIRILAYSRIRRQSNFVEISIQGTHVIWPL